MAAYKMLIHLWQSRQGCLVQSQIPIPFLPQHLFKSPCSFFLKPNNSEQSTFKESSSIDNFSDPLSYINQDNWHRDTHTQNNGIGQKTHTNMPNWFLTTVKRQLSGGKMAFQQMMPKQQGIQGGNKKNLNLSLTHYTKTNSKWIMNLNAERYNI